MLLSVLPSVLVLRRVVILVVHAFSYAIIRSVATLVVLRLLALLDSVVAGKGPCRGDVSLLYFIGDR